MVSEEETHYLLRTQSSAEHDYGSLQQHSLLDNSENERSSQRTGRYIPGSLDQLSSEYESLDYDPCLNFLWSDERRKRGYRFEVKKEFCRWIVAFWIGVITAIIAFTIDVSIEVLSPYKYTLLQNETNRCVSEGCLIVPFFLWLLLNAGPVLVAAILGSYIEPVSGGSGIPQVKCYLNGIKVPRIVRLKTLMCKVIGVIFSVLGGLAVGKEGPMIHSGAVVAAGLSQGKTTSLNYDFGILKFLRDDSEKRDFVSAGAAAGVAAAFGAPVALVSTFSLNILLSAFRGDAGNLDNPGLLNLGMFDDLTYQFFEFAPFVIMGSIGGLLGALFNQINYKLSVLRMRYLSQPWKKVLEAMFVAMVTASFGFLMIYTIPDCRDEDFKKNDYHVRMFCNKGQDNTAAMLLFQTPEQCVRSMFHDRNGSYGWSTVSVFFIIYYFLACWTYGLGVPSGLFIPSLLAGAAWGRICGMLLGTMFPNQPWVDEGKYALVGAAAMLGGVVRMTISLTVILMECVGNITFGLPLMIVVMISKWVGDYFNEGLYDIHIRLSGAPLIPWEPPPLTANVFASEVMSQPVITLNIVESVEKIYSILKTYSHNGFPVVDKLVSQTDLSSKEYGKLRGLILRSQLIILLKRKVFNENTRVWVGDLLNNELFRDSYPRFPTIEDVDLTAHDLPCRVDLRPFMNPSPYSVTSAASFQRIFRVFRALGLRHLVVLNDEHMVVGIVTRKDLVKFRVFHHHSGVSLGHLDVYTTT